MVHSAAAHANTVFNLASTQLLQSSVVDGLLIDQMLDDLIPQAPPDESTLVLAELASAFTIGKPMLSLCLKFLQGKLMRILRAVVAGALTPIPGADAFTGAVTALGGIFSSFAAIPGGSDVIDRQNIKTKFSTSLSHYLQDSMDSLAKFNKQLFGGDAGIDIADMTKKAGIALNPNVHPVSTACGLVRKGISANSAITIDCGLVRTVPLHRTNW